MFVYGVITPYEVLAHTHRESLLVEATSTHNVWDAQRETCHEQSREQGETVRG